MKNCYIKFINPLLLIILSYLILNNCQNRIIDYDINGNKNNSLNYTQFGALTNLWYKRDKPQFFSNTLDKADELGIGIIREGFLMDWFMPEKDCYDDIVIDFYDDLVNSVLKKNIQIYGTIDYENSWSPENYYAPYEIEHYENYANFVSFIVNRYKDKIKYWEIGNEPEVDQFWKPEANAYNFSQMLKYGYNAAKEADPECKVIAFSGFSSSLEYIQTFFDNDALNYMDILGIHPFSYCVPEYKSIFEMSDEYHAIDELRTRMKEYGKEVPLWVTEVGYPIYNGEFSVNEQRQAEMLVRTLILLVGKNIKQISWATLTDESDDPNAMDFRFGIYNYNLQARKALLAYKNYIEILGKGNIKNEITLDEKCKAFLFETPKNNVLVAWSFDEIINDNNGNITNNNKKIIINYSGKIDYIYNIYKKETAATLNSSSISLILTGSPVYIIGNFNVF